MKKLILLGFLVFISCQQTERKISGLISYIPNDSFCIFKINNLETFKNDLRNNHFIKQFEDSRAFQDFNDFISRLNYVDANGEILLCFNEIGKENFDYTFLTKSSNQLFKTDGLRDVVAKQYLYDTIAIDEIVIKGKTAYHAVLDKTAIISSSKLLIENIIRQRQSATYLPDESFNKVLASADENSIASVFIDGKESASFMNHHFPENNFFKKNIPYNWFGLDIDINQQKLIFNGVAIAKDSTGSVLSVFENLNTVENLLPEITPLNAIGIVSFTYEDWGELKLQLKKYNKNNPETNTKTSGIISYSDEAGVIFTNEGKAAGLHFTNIEGAKTELENYSAPADTHRSITIRKLDAFTLLVDEFTPLIENVAANFYAVLGDYIVFADNLSPIHTVIDNYQNKTTLANSEVFKALKKELNDQSSILAIAINPEFQNKLQKQSNAVIAKSFKSINLKEYPLFAFQLVADKGFLHTNGVISKIKTRKQAGTVSQLFSVILEADVLNNPQFISNHRTDEKDIVIQDNLNQLYLISNEGKIRWKKQLDGPVIGEIKQVDLFKNGRLQLAFNTQNKLYVLDIKGTNVDSFPINLKVQARQPLAVFDYDNNKNYRFIVCSEKEVLMFNGRGESVDGFTFKKAKNTIAKNPVHFRVSGKDYLLFTEKDRITILDRRGKQRVKVKGDLKPSGNQVYLYNNLITTTDASGNLLQIDFKGNIKRTGLGLQENHKIVASSKSLVTLTDNILTIKGKPIELDFGIYTEPKFFYVNNKIYVSVTDLQINKTYLYDSQGNSISNFPVYGNSAIDLTDLKNDNNITIVTKGEKNSLIVYGIN